MKKIDKIVLDFNNMSEKEFKDFIIENFCPSDFEIKEDCLLDFDEFDVPKMIYKCCKKCWEGEE